MSPKSRALTHWQGVLGVLPGSKPSPPYMFIVFDRSWSTTKGCWESHVVGLPSRHCWILHPMASRSVPSHHFPNTRFFRLLLAPNWLYTKGSMLSWEYIHLGLNLLATSGCRGPPSLELPTAPSNYMGRKGRLFFLMAVVWEPSG